MMVLWCLILRGISIEVRSHIDDRMWRTFFDVVFTFASVLLAIFLGAALGNVIRGVPINSEGYFFLPLFTNFRTGSEPGILDWYTVLTGSIALFALTMHGCTYLAVKTDGAMNSRARKIAGTAMWLVLALTVVALPATVYVRPEILGNFQKWPLGLALPVLAIGGLLCLRIAHTRGHDGWAFIASCAYLAGALGGAVFGLYPVILPAVGEEKNTLTIYNSSTSEYGMKVGIVWWLVGFALAAFYFIHLYRMFQGKVSQQPPGYGEAE
jgi:cytochrome d ubiquinol oxidase subunit II